MPIVHPEPRHVLSRILDEPALVAEVRALPPAALAKLIDRVGLEDAGEIVALATTEQIERVFDEDLWTRARAGDDETFDADRFVVWLEILLEAGSDVAARRLAELAPDVVTLAFHRLVSVVDTDALATEIAEGMRDDADEIEEALEGALSHELGEYMIIGRRHDGWDAIVSALVALDSEDHSTCARLLDRLVAMTDREAREEGGLHEVLSNADSLADDVAGDRNERRAGDGFVAPADARAFLKLARQSTDDHARDPVTKAYFRELDRSPRPEPPRLQRIIEAAELPKRRALPKRTDARMLATILGALDAAKHTTCREELAFLVNVLLAGDTKRWRPADAAEAVVAIVEHGLGVIAAASKSSPEAIVRADGIVPAFRAGVREGKLDERKRDRRQ